MRPAPSKTHLLTGALVLGASAAGLTARPAGAQSPSAVTPPTPPAPRGPAAVVSPRPVGTGRGAPVSPAAYWGPAAPAPPKRKPTAVRRFFNRIGTFLGADEEVGATPVYRDPTTGRTNTASMKPWMRPLEK